ncbi:MAG: HIT family protein [bacterium]
MMKKLWAPWRAEYLHCVSNGQGKKGCLFCFLRKSRSDKENLILHRGRLGFIVMNRFPYNSGHLMVALFRHTARIESLSRAETIEVFRLIQKSIKVLKLEFKPQGFNVGANLGPVAGAGVAGHIHFHIVPRWQGDTNFMPLLSETKVVSEHLNHTYDRLIKHFKKVKGTRG